MFLRPVLLLFSLLRCSIGSPILTGLTLGVDYYPESWGVDTWQSDAEAMQAAGITMVRMAEFSWHGFQPEMDGAYNFTWLDLSLDVLSAHGIRAIVGTPTASPPSWLYKSDPSIALIDNYGRRIGSGSRQNLNHLHPRVLSETRSIVSAIAAHYSSDSRVAGFQIDNEIHGDPDYSDLTRDSFQVWLSNKYGNSIDSLNIAWGTTFWGLQYDSFDEIPLPMQTTDFENPSMNLDFRRFIADIAGGYLELQAGLLRSGAPSKGISHNCMGSYSLVDYSRFASSLDLVAFDNYPLSWWSESSTPSITNDWSDASEQRIYAAVLQSLFMRGASSTQAPFYVMENQIANTGQLQYLGASWPEGARLAAWQMVANGADGVQFFRWRTSRWGVEQHWEGVLNWDGKTDTPRFLMVTQLGAEFARASASVFGTRVRARVAILHSPETRWSLLDTGITQPSLSVEPQMQGFLAAFRTHGIGVDMVYIGANAGRGSSSLPDLSNYSIVIAPTLLIVSDSLSSLLTTFVENGGQLLLTMRSGSHDENNVYTSLHLPGLLSTLAGITMDEWDPNCVFGERSVNASDSGQPFFFPSSTPFGLICEMLEPTSPSTSVLATYGSGYYKGRPAVTRNSVGAGGGVVYAGTIVHAEGYYYEWLASHLASGARIDWTPRLPFGIETSVREGLNSTVLFVLNWNSFTVNVSIPESANSFDIISNTTISEDGEMNLKPWAVAALRLN